MSDAAQRGTTPLEITVLYEPTRVASQALHAAYAAVLPTPRRMTVMHPPHTDDARRVEDHKAQGRAG